MWNRNVERMNLLRITNLVVRFALELGALASFSYWGATVPRGSLARASVVILAPLAAALFWGIFVSPKARISTGRVGRAGLGLLVFVRAAMALLARGKVGLAQVFAAVAVATRFCWSSCTSSPALRRSDWC